MPLEKLVEFINLHSEIVANYWCGNPFPSCHSWEVVNFKDTNGEIVAMMDHLYVLTTANGPYPTMQLITRAGTSTIPDNWETCEISYGKYPLYFTVPLCRNNNNGSVTTYDNSSHKSCYVENCFNKNTKLPWAY